MGLSDDTEVLIIGGGPVGLTAAGLLGLDGVGSLVVERRKRPQRAPAAHVLRRRSMEVFDRLGVAEEIRRRMPGVPLHFITWCSTLGGVEAGRLDFRAESGAGLEEDAWTNCPQNILEPILHEHVAALPNATIAMETECVGLEQSEHGVRARLRRADGGEAAVNARWAIACDGAASSTRRALDIPMVGQGALGNFFMIHFAADLRPWIDHRPGPLFWFLSPETPGTLIVHDPVKSHVFMSPVTGAADEEACLERRLRAALGVDVDLEILDVKTWAPHVQVAAHYRKGRVFLAGDAAHRFPPSGGLGLNTGILDVDNLVRKLVRVEGGVADASVLDRYESECRPAAEANANDSFENLQRLGDVWKAVGPCPSLVALETRLRSMSEDERRQLGGAIEAQRSHFVSDGHFPDEAELPPLTQERTRERPDPLIQEREMDNPKLPEFDESSPLRPARFGHIVLRSNHFTEMTRWYKAVLNAEPIFEVPGACFLTYDDEHHRVLIVSDPNATDRPETAAGVAHFAYLFNDLTELMSTYARLRDAESITPTYCVNHGFQFSLYYHDPDKNEVELGCDNFGTREQIQSWFDEGHFAKNFYGYNFDPEEVYAMHQSGVPDAEIYARTYQGKAPDLSRAYDEPT